MEREVIAEVRASTARRGFGIVTLALLGVMLIWVAFARPPGDLGWQAFLVVLGGVTLWLAGKMRQATAGGVVLTRDGLQSADGEVIAALDEIAAVDRSMFAFKPSNGFILRLRSGMPARWQPGLWWRLGRRVGVGGVTSKAQTRAMADVLAAMLAERA